MINTKTDYSSMCVNCYSKKRASHIPSKEIIMELILKYPMTQIGELYGVSDNAVRKWCKKYGLPFSKKDIDKLKIELHMH